MQEKFNQNDLLKYVVIIAKHKFNFLETKNRRRG